MNKGTILYIGGFELPDKNAAAQRVISNGKLLRDLGYKVIFDGVSKDNGQSTLIKSQFFFGFESYAQKYPKGFRGWLRYTFEINRYINIINKHSDTQIVICYNLPSGSLWRLKVYCKRKKIKLIADCTEWYKMPKGKNVIRNYTKGLDIFFRMKVLQPRLDGIITISSYLREFYKRKNKHIIEIPPLVDLEDSKWPNPLINISNNELQFFYAGSPFSLADKSNIKDRLDLIIEAFTLLKKEGYNFRFNILGITEREILKFFPQLNAMIEDKYFIFHGKTSHLKAIEMLKKSDYSIFLRDDNIVTKAGFPTKFVESISCGIPVITNKNSNLENYLKEGKNGFWVDMTSQELIKESIKQVFLQDSEHRKFMKKLCHESHIFDYRNYKKQVELFLNLKYEICTDIE